ncbi:MAG TPA: hypothetical protein VFY68_15865, partial [Nitrososphaeraceae archaeon]|nr:hypothetical protein [Nitrososphaeraceae archaeon]
MGKLKLKRESNTTIVSQQTKSDYERLLKRLQGQLKNTSRKEASRLELPSPQIIWVGQRTIFR